ncbi:ATP-binding protein [Chitinophaga solisilvae]|uniref:ATP-binding protein n=1 Tax=Chitinophaga solisilvae TaxID=1233460 RepID=UPI0013683943|nr:ATP-binding protein [Chitinophaga solisilvae]
MNPQKKHQRHEWQLVETTDFHTLITYFRDAQTYGNVFALTGPAGSGKTFAAAWYATNNTAVFHLECAEHWNRKLFLEKLLQAIGCERSGHSTGEMMEDIVHALCTLHEPLLILDEADKLSDQVLYFFITLYNLLHGRCGIVMTATSHLVKRVDRGRRLNRKGYAELYSRIGRRFIVLRGVNKKELTAICQANGISSAEDTAAIFHDCEGDIRRVERAVHKQRRKQTALS